MSSQPQTHVNPERLMQITWSFAQPLAIDSAIQNRVFEVLDAGPKSVAEISKETGASVRGLTAVMNLLAHINLLAKSADGRYSLTPESAAFLVSSKPGYMGGFIHQVAGRLAERFLQLPEITRTGAPPEGDESERPEAAAFFEQLVVDIMPLAYPPAQKLAEVLSVSRATQPVSVLDLASGSGAWGIALAQASPQVSVTAVDWPSVLEVTRRIAGRYGVAGQFHDLGGDLFKVDYGKGHSIATLGNILHMLGPAENKTLLKKTFDALAPGGTIAIGELLVDDDRNGPPVPLTFAINMLLHTRNGNAYTFAEIRSWLEETGFVNARLQAAPGPSPLVIAEKPRA
ncbi:MAG: methyltransferase [Candidatus Sulfotelmatobacter sp.]